MFEVSAENAREYFGGEGAAVWKRLNCDSHDLEGMSAEELAWGVSNVVIRVELSDQSFVLKQSRKQLRTNIDWFSQLERIWREVDVLRTLESVLPTGAVPSVLAEDRENFLFVMEAVEKDHRVWKAELLEGRFDSSVAKVLGQRLATIHRDTSDREDLRDQLSDQSAFDELRLDPFYRYVASTRPEFSASLNRLIHDSSQIRDCLVLADFSPKNILLTKTGPVIVDFETGHYGDPGFDLGFFLSHLLLKTILHADRAEEAIAPAQVFWSEYQKSLNSMSCLSWIPDGVAGSTFEERSVRHLATCMLARVDGKSRIDYLRHERQRDCVREFCQHLFESQIASIECAFEWLKKALSGHC